MADLNVNVNETSRTGEGVGYIPIFNNFFESAPSFTAATNLTTRWIDGTASGSLTDASHGWAILQSSTAGSFTAQFDTATFHEGAVSMKVSTTATSSNLSVSNARSAGLSDYVPYCPLIAPSTLYKYSFYMKTNYVSGDSSDGASVTFSIRNSAGSSVQENTSTKVKTTVDWTQYTGSFTTPSTAVYLLMKLSVTGNTGTGTLIMDAWYDEINLWPSARDNGVDAVLGPIVTAGIQDVRGPKIWS